MGEFAPFRTFVAVRAIISTGYENDAMAQAFLDQGFCGYLTKPYRVADLGKVLKTVLG